MPETPAQRLPVSTVLLTKNVAALLPQYLASMRDVDDIIVLDGGSTDGTVELLQQQPNCRVFPQNPAYIDQEGFITDFSALRNEGYALAKHPWILCIDADESATRALLNQVRHIIDRGKPGVYFVQRLFTIHGEKIVSFDAGDHIRLFHLSCVRGCVKPVHERLDIIPGSYIGHLDEVVVVPIDTSKNLRPKYDRYLRIEVKALRDCTFGRWFRWIFLRNCISIVRRILVIIAIRLVPKKGPRYPLSLEVEQMRYVALLTWYTCPLYRLLTPSNR